MGFTFSKLTPLGLDMPAFSLPSAQGQYWSNADLQGTPTVLAILCNHCPYVHAVEDRIDQLTRDYRGRIQVIGINANDPDAYPEDSFEAMVQRSQHKDYAFPYLWDQSQDLARSLGAECTPDFFLFNTHHRLVYRGRLDDSWKDPQLVTSQDLRKAIEGILNHQPISTDQKPSLGCSIKWRNL